MVGNGAHYLEKKGRCDDEEINDEVAIFSEQQESIGGREIEDVNVAIREKELKE